MPKLSGLKDKLYWREVSGRFHCFAATSIRIGDGTRYRSLCLWHWLRKVNGQQNARPEPVRRCARCDNLEAERRGWDGSGPTLAPTIGKK
jgi:hypothetical protein